jgi:threonine/homoserine/homoserine lactone efflux protein
MIATLIIKGLIVGTSIAAPVGPIGILCINRTLQQGFRVGLLTGYGAALADGIYAVIAGLSLTYITQFMSHYQSWFTFLAGILLVLFGIKIAFSTPNLTNQPPLCAKKKLLAFLSSFLLTLTNPMTIFSFVVIFAGLGAAIFDSYLNSSVFVIAVIVGSLAWWFFLCGSVSFLKLKIDARIMKLTHYLSAAILGAFGIQSMIKVLI